MSFITFLTWCFADRSLNTGSSIFLYVKGTPPYNNQPSPLTLLLPLQRKQSNPPPQEYQPQHHQLQSYTHQYRFGAHSLVASSPSQYMPGADLLLACP